MKKAKGFSVRQLINGVFLGSTLLAPGLSVATIAMVIGIYQQLINTINDFFSRKWKQSLYFLVPMAIGAVVALFITGRLFSWADESYPYELSFLFLGLIAGSIPILIKSSKATTSFKLKHTIVLFVMALLVASIAFIGYEEVYATATTLDATLIMRLLFAGFVGAAAMLLPGLSAALLLLILGVHPLLSHAISNLNITIIGITLIGSLVGLVIGSRIIKYVLEKHNTMTNAVSIGMVIGSIIVVFPGVPRGMTKILTCLVMLILGVLISVLLEKYKNRGAHNV